VMRFKWNGWTLLHSVWHRHHLDKKNRYQMSLITDFEKFA
jgi:hypothetical protein